MRLLPTDPLAPITAGYDFNFFQKITVTATNFNTDADMLIPFLTQGIILLDEDNSAIVEVSFNGNTIHDELNPTITGANRFQYDDRVVSKIWFKLKSAGSAVVSVRAWAAR